MTYHHHHDDYIEHFSPALQIEHMNVNDISVAVLAVTSVVQE